MSIVKTYRFGALEKIQRQLNQFFADAPNRDRAFVVPDWAPPADIQETEKEFTVTVDLPQMKKEDIRVGIENGMLSIEGERLLEKEDKDRKFHRVERQYGRFVRRFTMPSKIEAARVQAQYKDGTLTVTLPKSARALPQAVEVKVA